MSVTNWPPTFQDRKGVQVRALKERLKPHARTRISPEDMRRLCNAPDRTTLKGLRDAALLHTLASSGIRVSEAATLTIEQVVQKTNNGKSGYLLLVRGKTDEEAREAPLSPEAYAAILAWRERCPVSSSYLFLALDGRGAALAGAAHDHGGGLANRAAVCQPV